MALLKANWSAHTSVRLPLVLLHGAMGGARHMVFPGVMMQLVRLVWIPIMVRRGIRVVCTHTIEKRAWCVPIFRKLLWPPPSLPTATAGRFVPVEGRFLLLGYICWFCCSDLMIFFLYFPKIGSQKFHYHTSFRIK